MRRLPLLLTLLFAPALGGCPEDTTPDAGAGLPDSGTEADATVNPDAETTRTLSLNVSSVFPAGTAVKDGYSGARGTVGADGTLTLEIAERGVALLEKDLPPGPEASFSWDNATVYFAITDRFNNGDPSNDHSYGRQSDGLQEVGTWHGGDWKGLTQKLDYLKDLGVNALWISAPYEQVHGWVGGGAGEFPHYAYHGYWALDFTKLDQNFGSGADLAALVAGAHQRGIRLVLDVVMNHPGYATGADLLDVLPAVFSGPFTNDWRPPASGTWHDWNMLVDYNSPAWLDWWGPTWVRAGFPGYNGPGMGDLTMSLAFLPDFMTEDFRPAGLPPFFARKPDTEVVEIPSATVRQYLVSWLSRWVRDYGIDGFRCDTAKHVELPAWKELKTASNTALHDWKTAHPTERLDDSDFWMTGEVFPHGVTKDAYFTDGGFDSLINFDFQRAAANLIRNYDMLDTTYRNYATALNTDPAFNVLSYASSHDTYLFFHENGDDLSKQYDLGFAMLMLPGGVQIMYGDETARPYGPSPSDRNQGTRSDMNWSGYDPGLLAHWQKLGTFRNRHRAVGAGMHRKLDFSGGYAFARELDAGGVSDKVIVVRLQ